MFASRRTSVLSFLILGAANPAVLPAQKTTAPANGMEVLQRMHDAYAGKWYNTLTFTQRTIVTRGVAKPDTSIWYESLKGPALLRIDQGTPPAANGALYTADSLVSIRMGVARPARAPGNQFLPLIMGVYLQPLAETERQLKTFGFDLTRVMTLEQGGRNVIVVGTSERYDTTSAQFWIDAERLVVVRMLGKLTNAGSADIRLDGYEKAGGGWLATRVKFIGAAFTQVEEYYDWNVTRNLPDALFDPAQWKTAPHWAAPH